jgi:uncharacterized membrane protein
MSKAKQRWQDRKEKLARERIEKAEHRRKMALAGVVAAIALVAGTAIYLIMNQNGGDQGYVPAVAANTDPSSGAVTIPASEIGADARFYTYDSGGTKVRFFAARGADGTMHVAADACDVSSQSHKGYRQSGTSMQCQNCGKTFSIDHIGTKNTAGGCWPSYLPMETDGSNVLVKKSDLDGKAYMFR